MKIGHCKLHRRNIIFFNGFLGFLLCIESLKKYNEKYVRVETPLLKFILTYKFSQDHLDIFFSAVRTRGGHNNNPSARQFEAIYKTFAPYKS